MECGMLLELCGTSLFVLLFIVPLLFFTRHPANWGWIFASELFTSDGLSCILHLHFSKTNQPTGESSS